MKNILIAENKEQADQHIEHLKTVAAGINSLIEEYNSIEALDNLQTKEEIKTFLANPAEYFNDAVLNSVEIKSKAKLRPHAVAEMTGIPYGRIMQRIGITTRSGLEHLLYVEETGKLEFDPASEKHIREAFKEYCEEGPEAKMYERINKLCKELNELAELFNLYPHDLNGIANSLGFVKAVVKEGGHGWELIPNISAIRNKFEYQEAHNQ